MNKEPRGRRLCPQPNKSHRQRIGSSSLSGGCEGFGELLVPWKTQGLREGDEGCGIWNGCAARLNGHEISIDQLRRQSERCSGVHR
jgi:hypothetical protein